jgi:hypothetical protein
MWWTRSLPAICSEPTDGPDPSCDSVRWGRDPPLARLMRRVSEIIRQAERRSEPVPDDAAPLSGSDFAAPLIMTENEFRFMETERCAKTGLSDAPVIVEPQRPNTAPAILAAALMLEQTPDAYWSSGIYAGIIHRLGPGAERLAAVQLPTTMTTMPCFGGGPKDPIRHQPDIRQQYNRCRRRALLHPQGHSWARAPPLFLVTGIGAQSGRRPHSKPRSASRGAFCKTAAHPQYRLHRSAVGFAHALRPAGTKYLPPPPSPPRPVPDL